MELDSIKGYVKKYSEAYLPLSSIKSLAGVYIFIGLVPLIAGIVTHKFIVMSVFIVAEIFYITAVNVLERKLASISYYQRFLLSASSSLFMSLFFLMIPYLLIETSDLLNREVKFTYSVIIGLAWILAVFLIFTFKIYNIKKGAYSEAKEGQKKGAGLAIASSIGAVSGISLMKFASKWMTQEVAINVAFILCYIVSVLAALGIPHFLVAYFVKKYSIPGESLPVIRKKMSAKKRLAIKILIIFLALLTIVTILGVLVDKGILK